MERLFEKQMTASDHITRAVENLKRVGQANITLGVVETKADILDRKWEAFLTLHEQIEEDATKEERNSPYFKNGVYNATEDAYVLNKGKFLDVMRQLKGELAASQRSATVAQASSAQQLPKISLPKFSGAYSEWSAFRNLFTSMVKDNEALSEVQKHHYLKTSLLKDPAALIASLPLSAENLAVAWALLTDRYENKRLLVAAQISSIFALPAMKTESSLELRTLFNGTTIAVSALKALGRPIAGYDDFLVHLTVHKLDAQSRREWESRVGSSKAPPSFGELQTFLEARACTIEALETPATSSSATSKPSGSSSEQPKGKQTHSRVKSHQASSAPSSAGNAHKKCSFCQQGHYIAFCDTFRSKSPDERKAFALSSKLCFNCLGPHFSRECRSQKTCQTCKAKHHSMLHDALASISGPPSAATVEGPLSHPSTSASPTDPSTGEVAVHNVRCDDLQPSGVLLATAVVNIRMAGGALCTARVLLDQGSEASFVSESLAQRLRLPRTPASVTVTGIGGKFAGRCRGRVAVTLSSRVDARCAVNVDALVLSRLTAYVPPRVIDGVRWSHLDGLTLADPDSSSNLTIEILLGADQFPRLLLPGVEKGPLGTPVAQNTLLGWILSGTVSSQPGSGSPHSSLHLSLEDALSSSLQRFWEQEEIATTLPMSAEDVECENHFLSTHSRNETGRFVVRLPFKKPPSLLGESFSSASRVLERMELRFSRDSRFHSVYSEFMVEYEALAHMEMVSPAKGKPPLAYYLPHHGVIRESSETTKFGVVFNGSQKTSSGLSLNDCLHIGPKLLPELIDVITRWRTHAIVFSADMEKMFRQILLHPLDRDLQRILWRHPSHKLPDAYRLRTVTYGLASAPYLAIRIIRQLALDEKSRFPLAAEALTSDVYVDDVLSGASDVDTALAKQHEIIEALKAGGFPLRKWTSNSPALLARLSPSVVAAGANYLVPSESSFHMLGLSWQADIDCFVFRLKSQERASPPTKRTVLSRVAELFDPLGWLAPVIVTAKIFMQSLWLLKLGWDDPLPETEARTWDTFYSDLARISDYRIRRWLQLRDSSFDCEIHGFADASERAYAAVVYICSTHPVRSATLGAAKTKVAPVKQVSLPRLELCAAHLLAKLVKRIQGVLNHPCSIHLWSDSTVTLAWIRGHPTRWKTFVANRVSEIQCSLPSATWRHVESKENPADCASRGLTASELRTHELWWSGPPWLLSPPQNLPTKDLSEPEDPPEQRIATHAAALEVAEPFHLLTRYSSLTRLQRITAWCLRFLVNSRVLATRNNAKRETSSTLLPSELAAALAGLVRVEQIRSFRSDIATLKARSALTKGPLLRLNPFIDSEGLLRVGGRLKHSVLDADEKHPYILSRDSPLAPLIIDNSHRRTMHGGTLLTLATLRQRFWILSARAAVKAFIGRCIPCLRFRASKASQLMRNLPKERVTRSRPFLHSGVDYCS